MPPIEDTNVPHEAEHAEAVDDQLARTSNVAALEDIDGEIGGDIDGGIATAAGANPTDAEYDTLVADHNALVTDYNALVVDYNALVVSHNSVLQVLRDAELIPTEE